jgi:hypothetical protein
LSFEKLCPVHRGLIAMSGTWDQVVAVTYDGGIYNYDVLQLSSAAEKFNIGEFLKWYEQSSMRFPRMTVFLR